jgi:predicted aldo/keto reductase-like oxidoreductase
METRRLGRTGHESSVIALGAAVLWKATSEDGERALSEALAAGVNHVDIAPMYGDAQQAVGPHVPPVRDRIFLGTKSHRADGGGFRAHLEETLGLLGTDRTDLHQLHAVVSLEVLEERVAGGAVDALLKARDEGLTRFVGITGHGLDTPAAQLEALRRYDLDTVMFPLNPGLWNDPAYRADAEALLDHCQQNDLGVHILKAAARRPWADGQPHVPWYEPWTDPADIERGLRFALATPGVHTLCSASDWDVFRASLAAGAEGRLTPMTDAERAEAIAIMAEEPKIPNLA